MAEIRKDIYDDTVTNISYGDGYEIVTRTMPTGEVSVTANPSRPYYYNPSWTTSPSITDTTTLRDPYRTSISGDWLRAPIFTPDEVLGSMPDVNWDTMLKASAGLNELPEMNMFMEELVKEMGRRYAVNCKNPEDFTVDRILKNISVMKSKLMLSGVPVQIQNIECKMTPKVKENLITAWRKVNMFGKKVPIVARFDEYGNRLEDKIRIETLEGMRIEIVDPKHYGEYYLSFEGIARPGY